MPYLDPPLLRLLHVPSFGHSFLVSEMRDGVRTWPVRSCTDETDDLMERLGQFAKAQHTRDKHPLGGAWWLP